MKPTALVAGASGITGSYLAEHLASLGWSVYGLARKPPANLEGVRPVAADLLEPASLKAALNGIEPTHVFITTWLRQANEAENCRVNGAMVENLLSVTGEGKSLQHVALVTGGKNYFGSFDEQGQYEVTTPFREEQPGSPGSTSTTRRKTSSSSTQRRGASLGACIARAPSSATPQVTP